MVKNGQKNTTGAMPTWIHRIAESRSNVQRSALCDAQCSVKYWNVFIHKHWILLDEKNIYRYFHMENPIDREEVMHALTDLNCILHRRIFVYRIVQESQYEMRPRKIEIENERICYYLDHLSQRCYFFRQNKKIIDRPSHGSCLELVL